MTIAVIIPVYNSGMMLHDTLRALARSQRAPDELIIVDDGSMDDSGAVALGHGAHVITMKRNAGPAICRNQAALTAKSDVLVFLDADTCIHADTLDRIVQRLEGDPGLGAVIGSYDEHPADPGLCSQFRNLAHCYVHHSSNPHALTFWSGCGAVRRDLFFSIGGFDETYRRPSIEDIDFGYRLSDTGIRILLDPDILVTHLKHWTLRNAIFTDILDRGIPWMVLLLQRGHAPRDLNIRLRHRVATLLTAAAVVCLPASLFSHHWLWLACGLSAASIGMDAGLLYFIYRQRGVRLLFAAMALTLVQNLCKLLATFGGLLVYAYRSFRSGTQTLAPVAYDGARKDTR